MPATVAQYMSTKVVTVQPAEPLRRAVELELSHHVRHLPVLDDTGAVVGIVTDRDIKRALPSPLGAPDADEYDAVLDGVPVSRVMTREPLTIGPAATVADAVRILIKQKIGGLPVVDGGALIGIFTETDALRALLEVLEPGK